MLEREDDSLPLDDGIRGFLFPIFVILKKNCDFFPKNIVEFTIGKSYKKFPICGWKSNKICWRKKNIKRDCKEEPLHLVGTTNPCFVVCWMQNERGGCPWKSSQVKYGSQIHGSEQKHNLVMFWSHSLKCSVKGIIMVTEEKPAMAGTLELLSFLCTTTDNLI